MIPRCCQYLILGCGVGGLTTACELLRHRRTGVLLVDAEPTLPAHLGNGVHYLHDDNLDLPFEFKSKEIPHTEELWDPSTDVFRKEAFVPDLMKYSLKVGEVRYPGSLYALGKRDWKTVVPVSNNTNDLLHDLRDYAVAQGAAFEFGTKLVKLDPGRRVAYFVRDKFEIEVYYEHLFSTMPLPRLEELAGAKPAANYSQKPIHISNYETEKIVPDWLVLLYISDPEFLPFRITLLNGTISMESMELLDPGAETWVWHHLKRHFDYKPSGSKFVWKTGRIRGLDSKSREKVIADFAAVNIHLLGRYGTWNQSLEMVGTIRQAQQAVRRLL